MSFAYQPIKTQEGIDSYESLFRGCATTTHAAPGPLFSIIALASNTQIATEWKIREIKEAIDFSVHVQKPVSINFTQAEVENKLILEAITSLRLVKTNIDMELLETGSWTVENVKPLRELFRQIHFDDAKLSTLGLAALLCEAGCLDAIKLDIMLLVQAFRVPVFFAEGEENLSFKEKIPDEEKSAEMRKELMEKVGEIMTAHKDVKFIFEASIPFENIASAFVEAGFDSSLAARCPVQGAETGAQAFVKRRRLM